MAREEQIMDKLYIVMPAYNEAENIEEVVREWYPVLDGKDKESRLVIADGGSKDNTLDILYKLKKTYPKLEVFSKPGTDHGTKLIFLYDYAIKSGADFIFQTDSDGQTIPDEFHQFWQLRNTYDAILGNRTKRGDGQSRAFVENVLRFILWIYFRAKTPDANAPFRLMKADLVKKYIYRLPEDFNLPNALLAAYFSVFKEKVKYIEITFRPRQGGKNYINVKRIVGIGWESLKNFYKLRKELYK